MTTQRSHPTHPKAERSGRQRLGPPELELLGQLVEADPAATVTTLAERLASTGRVAASRATVGRALKRMGRTRTRRAVAAPPAAGSRPDRRYRPRAVVRSTGRPAYPSDLTDEEWALVAPWIPEAKPGGRPAKHARRELLDAMLYVLRTGCQWSALPHDFPPWKTVHTWFRLWRLAGVFENLNAEMRRRLRLHEGRHPVATAWVIDAQTAKTTERGGPMAMTRARR